MKKWALLVVGVFLLTATVSVQADTVLFPWVVKDSAISTIVSLVNTDNPDAKVRYHLIYEYKKSTENGQTEACEEVDFCVPTSFNDVLVFDAAANFGDGAALFGDTGAGAVTYQTVQANNALSLPVDGPRRAFLLVNNEEYTTQQCGRGDDAPDGTLYGEAMVVDITIGAAWGYRAYNPYGNVNWLNFSDNGADAYSGSLPSDAYGEVLAGNEGEVTQSVFMPPNVFTTKLFVTPVSSDQWNGTLASKVYLFCSRDDNGTFTGIFDDDENCISFDKAKSVVCTDASSLDHYVSTGAWITFVNTNGPGWAWITAGPAYALLKTATDPVVLTDQVVLGKLEYSIGRTSIDGGQVEGAINNFIWLRAHTTPRF